MTDILNHPFNIRDLQGTSEVNVFNHPPIMRDSQETIEVNDFNRPPIMADSRELSISNLDFDTDSLLSDIESLSDFELSSQSEALSNSNHVSGLGSKSIFPYAKLPPEIQVKICEYALLLPTKSRQEIFKDYSRSRSAVISLNSRPSVSMSIPSNILYPAPELLAALRPISNLYSEALVIFYKINKFPLSLGTMNRFMQLKPKALELIENVSLTVG